MTNADRIFRWFFAGILRVNITYKTCLDFFFYLVSDCHCQVCVNNLPHDGRNGTGYCAFPIFSNGKCGRGTCQGNEQYFWLFKQRLLCAFCYIKITVCFNYNIYSIPQVKLDLCVADLEKIKDSSNSCHLQKLNEDLISDTTSTVKGHHLTKSAFKLDHLAEEFIDSLVDNIKSRYINCSR